MAPRAESAAEWLIKIKEGQDPPTKTKPLIQEAAKTLREIESNKGCFDPLVVSLGPYHHDKPRLQPMESYKEVTARWFFSRAAGPISTITNEEMKTVYGKFVAEVKRESSPRDLYARKFIGEDSDFMQMMFLDGCFILHFIHLVLKEPFVKEPYEPSKSSHLNQPLIVRDMFLLENQIPYTVLKALMSLMPKGKSSSSQSNEDNPIVKFINWFFLPSLPESSHTWGIFTRPVDFLNELFSSQDSIGSGGSSSNSASKKEDIEVPLHLLDLLRIVLIGKVDSPSSSETGSCVYYFRSIMELKEAGIKVRKGNSRYFKDVEFKKGSIQSHLHLPQLLVDDATKTNLLNLIAYELCPDGLSDRTVTSYICFLGSLIDHAEDVKELRSKDILLNRLGSDEEVAKLFNELANHLMPNCHTYAKVTGEIQAHIKDRFMVRLTQFMYTQITQFMHTHPWTVLSSIGATVVILLTLLQTIYTIKGYNNDMHHQH